MTVGDGKMPVAADCSDVRVNRQKKDTKPSWCTPPPRLSLSGQDLHVWRAFLDLPGRSIQDLKGSLSIDERMKAENFHFERDRSRFIAARGILRLILSSYLSVEPGTIQFCYEEGGKPRLHRAFCDTGIQFNLSHSEGLALYVFTRDHEVGVDVEYMREISEMGQIVEQFFSVRERAFFATSPSNEKREMFFSWWTRSEALMKAAGEGLSYPIDNSSGIPTIGESVGSSGRGDAKEGPRWSTWAVRPAERFAGAVVAEGEGWDVQYWQWQD